MKEDYDLISVDIAESEFGTRVGKGVLRTHGASSCIGPTDEDGRSICCIHNQSDHHMRTWPQIWRGDKEMMERLCQHGESHPDPDDFRVRMVYGARSHTCDGCCAPTSSPGQPST